MLVWTITLLSYLLMSLTIFSLAVVLLYRFINPGKAVLPLVLALVVLVSIMAAATYAGCALAFFTTRTGRWAPENKDTILRFFAIRCLFFTVSLTATWVTYAQVLKHESYRVALSWAFVLENAMVLTIILTALALRAHLRR